MQLGKKISDTMRTFALMHMQIRDNLDMNAHCVARSVLQLRAAVACCSCVLQLRVCCKAGMQQLHPHIYFTTAASPSTPPLSPVHYAKCSTVNIYALSRKKECMTDVLKGREYC